MRGKIIITTKERYELTDITSEVEEIVKNNNLENGIITVFVPHSTAAILLTENEEGLKKDWIDFFKNLVAGKNFLHDRIDNNADSHLLSGLLGQGKVLPVKNKKIVRGTWQNIFLAEFDGPRERSVEVVVIS